MVQLNDISECQYPVIPEKESLLKKFEIPIDHLDFKYLETCNNAKEIEQIVQILRSGQEGVFPELLKFAEERLAKLKPNSKFLRKTVRVLSEFDLPKDEWQELSADIQNWIEDVNKNDKELTSFQDIKLPTNVPVRESKSQKSNTAKKSAERIKSMDYEAWDKLDVDAELLKEEIKDTKIKEEIIEKTKVKEKLNTVVLDPDLMPKAELKHSALQARNAGNECFKSKDYEDALQYYTNSIIFFPTVEAYNNRAITNIKLKSYNDAIKDCNVVLKLEASNEKAHLRKSLAYKSLKKYDDALETLEKLLQINPNNVNGQNMIQDVKKKLGNSENLRTVRMKIIEEHNNISDSCEKSENNVKNNDIKNTATKHLTQDNQSKKEIGSGDSARINIREINDKTNNEIQNDINVKNQTQEILDPTFKHSILKSNEIKKKESIELSTYDNQNNENAIQENKQNNGFREKIDTNKNTKLNSKIKNDERNNDNVLIPIPGTSKFSGPFYKVVNIPNGTAKKFLSTKKTHSKSDENVIDLNKSTTSISSSYKTSQSLTSVNLKDILCNDDDNINNESIKIDENISVINHSTNKINECMTERDIDSKVVKDIYNKISNISYENDEKLNSDISRDFPPNVERLNINFDDKETDDVLITELTSELNNFTPYEFLKYWQAIKNDTTFEEHEKLLRLLNPTDLVNVVGNKLDGEMFSLLLKCLETRFTKQEDSVFIANMLLQLQKLPRIEIIMLLMNENDKEIIRNLVGRISTEYKFHKEVSAKYCSLINI